MWRKHIGLNIGLDGVYRERFEGTYETKRLKKVELFGEGDMEA